MRKYFHSRLLNYAGLILAAAISAVPCTASADVFTVNGDDFYVITTTEDHGAGGKDMLTMRLSINAAESWGQTWGTVLDDHVSALPDLNRANFVGDADHFGR